MNFTIHLVKPTQIAKFPRDKVFHYYDRPFGYSIRRCSWTSPQYECEETDAVLGHEVTCKRCPITQPMITIRKEYIPEEAQQ